HNGHPVDPSLWQEDRYFYESTKYSGFNEVKESVDAGYIMTQGKFGHNGFLTGVRVERTDTDAEAYVKSRVASTTAQQTADPVGAAAADYANNWRVRDG